MEARRAGILGEFKMAEEESIYNLIPRPQYVPPKDARYKSKVI